MDFISLITSYVDVGSVLLGVVLTHLVRYFMPTPKGSTSKFNIGPIAYKCMPFVPLLIGAATVVIKDGLVTPTLGIDEAVVKGVVSGAVAAYVFRTTKIQIFGKQVDEEKEEVTTDQAKGLMDKVKDLIK
jgi:hypothetical protein